MGFWNTNRFLNLVSRSFAICIPKFPKQVRSEVGNFYLLCRYADSIEDSGLSLRKKKIFFRRFTRALKGNDRQAMNDLNLEVLPWVQNDNDKLLVKNFEVVFRSFQRFDKKSKRIALRWLREMTKGMAAYSKKEIANFLDLDNYCYYVAGTVGMYVTEILDHKFGLHKYKELKARGKDFGLLLQKVNIIRDFAKDFSAGRVFWPTELFDRYSVEKEQALDGKNIEKNKQMLQEMVQSAEKNINSSLEYLEMLPDRLRLVCAIPLFMAIPTLLKCYGNDEVFDASKKVKLSRVETMQIISMIEKNAGKDSFPKEYFEDLNRKNEHGYRLEIK